MTATGEEIARHFVNLSARDAFSWNWGTEPRDAKGFWDVDEDTYINGIMLTIDRDYEMGNLIEIVERSSGMTTWMAIETRPGGWYQWSWYEAKPQPFYDREVEEYDLYLWFINWYECNQEIRRDRDG